MREALRRARKPILVLAALIGLSGALVPAMGLSREGADRDVRIFHWTIGFTESDLHDPDAISAAVSQVAGSVFGGAAHTSPRIPLSQFTGTVAGQAQREAWVSLVLDVWIGGDGPPAGYYFRYQGRNAAGELARGESFLTSPDEVEKLRLFRPSGLTRRMIGGYDGLVGNPEHFLAHISVLTTQQESRGCVESLC